MTPHELSTRLQIASAKRGSRLVAKLVGGVSHATISRVAKGYSCSYENGCKIAAWLESLPVEDRVLSDFKLGRDIEDLAVDYGCKVADVQQLIRVRMK